MNNNISVIGLSNHDVSFSAICAALTASSWRDFSNNSSILWPIWSICRDFCCSSLRISSMPAFTLLSLSDNFLFSSKMLFALFMDSENCFRIAINWRFWASSIAPSFCSINSLVFSKAAAFDFCSVGLFDIFDIFDFKFWISNCAFSCACLLLTL